MITQSYWITLTYIVYYLHLHTMHLTVTVWVKLPEAGMYTIIRN